MDGGVTVHRMQPPGQEIGREFPVYNGPTYSLGYTWSVLRHIHRLIQMTGIDVIDFAEYGAEGFAYQLDRVPENWVPVVVQLHAPLAMLAEHIGWPQRDSEFYRLGTFMEGVSIRQADGLMACSANIADFTSNFYDVPRELIDVVHCGVDADAFHVASAGRRMDKRPTVLFVGNVAPSKGVETVFDAVMRLRSNYPDIHLQVLGTGDSGLISKLQERAQQVGAANNAEFRGFVQRDELPDFYRSADVLCTPAQYEGGVANVLLEAMACGCPIVTSDAGGSNEAVAHGETGLLVPPGDVTATAAALDRMLGDERLRQQLGRAGRRRVETYFAMDKYILRVLRVYEMAIKRARDKLSAIEEERMPPSQGVCCPILTESSMTGG
jgi:glycosyltransferase involved in cell wall biosynthesis